MKQSNYHNTDAGQIVYPEEHRVNTMERVLKMSLYRNGLRSWRIDLHKLTDEKLFKLLQDIIKEGE